MTRQLLKAATMLVGIITLALASAMAASAQNSRSLVVNIPFEFSVGGKLMPAGDYIVSRSSTNDQTILNRRDGKANAIVLTKTLQARDRQSESRLVFNRYGERYFLSSVWISGEELGRELYKSRQERAIANELAKNDVEAETVTLVARVR